jgi:hypothetical protein
MISPPISCHQSGDADPADLLVDGAPPLDIFELKISVDQVADWSQYVDNATTGTGMRADARARSADAGGCVIMVSARHIWRGDRLPAGECDRDERAAVMSPRENPRRAERSGHAG